MATTAILDFLMMTNIHMYNFYRHFCYDFRFQQCIITLVCQNLSEAKLFNPVLHMDKVNK